MTSPIHFRCLAHRLVIQYLPRLRRSTSRLATALPAVAVALGLAPCPTRAAEPVAAPAPSAEAAAPADNGSSESIAASSPEIATDAPKFLRLVRDDRGRPLALETAVVSYRPAGNDDGRRLDLIAAVHIAEQDYYAQLNRIFRDYQAVLYELVAPAGTRVPRGGAGPSAHPVGLMQNALRGMLKLDYQLDEIDYQQPNMLHADMSPEQFEKSMQDRGENFFTMFFRMLGQSMARQAAAEESGQQQPSMTDADLLRALFSPNRAAVMKQLMAEQFEMMDGAFDVLGGPDGSTIIHERNKVALTAAAQQWQAGQKRLAIFYGAGHMGDMHQRLVAEHGLTPAETRWLVAWRLTGSRPPADASPSTDSPTATDSPADAVSPDRPAPSDKSLPRHPAADPPTAIEI